METLESRFKCLKDLDKSLEFSRNKISEENFQALTKLIGQEYVFFKEQLGKEFELYSLKFKELIEQNPEEAYKIFNSFINEPAFKDYFSTQDFKKAFFLENNEFGKLIHNKVIANYSDIKAITKINVVGKGSNPFYVVAINEVLRQKYPDLRTATQANLERIIKKNILVLKGCYEDSALVLRTRQEPNSYLAHDLFEQFNAKGINLKEDSAYLIWLCYLSLRKDINSPHKLSFVLPYSLEVLNQAYFEAPILNSVSPQNFDSSDVDIKTGIPTILSDKGERTFYTTYDGLSGVYLNGGGDLDANNDALVFSDDDGRVVFVSNAESVANAKKFI
jgi:hypothetical protein